MMIWKDKKMKTRTLTRLRNNLMKKMLSNEEQHLKEEDGEVEEVEDVEVEEGQKVGCPFGRDK